MWRLHAETLSLYHLQNKPSSFGLAREPVLCCEGWAFGALHQDQVELMMREIDQLAIGGHFLNLSHMLDRKFRYQLDLIVSHLWVDPNQSLSYVINEFFFRHLGARRFSKHHRVQI